MAGMMSSILTGLLVLVGILMTFLIMLQESKGGGLAALGGTKAAGVEGVTNPVRRATVYMAALFFILAVTLAIMNRPEAKISIGGEKPAETSATTTATGPDVNVSPAFAAPTVTARTTTGTTTVPATIVTTTGVPQVHPGTLPAIPATAPATTASTSPETTPATTASITPATAASTTPATTTATPATTATPPIEKTK